MSLRVATKEQRLKELKLRAKPINFLEVEIGARGMITAEQFATDLENRIINGYAIVWGNKNHHGEKIIKGAADKSINERGPSSNAKYKITFLYQHKQDDPMSLFAELVSDDYGLRFRTMPLDPVPSAERTLVQIKSGTLNQFSIGFDYVWDKIQYDETDDSLVLLQIDLFEISVVTIGSDSETMALRSAQSIEALADDTLDFIETLPRKDRWAARNLFSRYKSLVQLEEDKPQDDQKQSVLRHLYNNL